MLDDVFPVPARALIRQGGRACFYRLVNTSPLLIQVQSGTKIVMADDKALRLEAGAYGLLPDYRPLTMENSQGAAEVSNPGASCSATALRGGLYQDGIDRRSIKACPRRHLEAAGGSRGAV
ncbi:hypothetical protein FHS25_003042 [Rhizobium laguerreae]|uniref:Uncharacterized protein n=1 Tax=Rhizobium laguerreae TaxID=1076926 RepID=A0ABR6G8H7_9HYPH|nr:hypothetical protein [Rhizobium laguerreae]